MSLISLLLLLITPFLLILVALQFLLKRNDYILQFLNNELRNIKHTSSPGEYSAKMYLYEQLPSYNSLVFRYFYIWDVEKLRKLRK